MTDTEQQTDDLQAPTPSRWQRVIARPEGKFLLAGVAALILYMTLIGLTRLHSADLCHNLLLMTGTHIVGGRAAGMSSGYAHGLSGWVIVTANMAIETFMVLLFYPLFVFSYDRLIVIKPLEESLARARHAAKAHERTALKLGIPGLLLFVWFPFWMTGPLVGSVIGFLIGLRPWVNLSVVLAGTYLAIFCWGVILRRIHDSLAALGPYVPFAFVALILLLAVSIHIRHAFSRHATLLHEEEEGQVPN
jgi:uncharacterized membrane protein